MAAIPYQLNDVAIAAFHDMFINVLQQSPHKLAGTYQYVPKIVGESYQWPIAGSADMHRRSGGPLSKIPNTAVTYTPVVTQPLEWVLKLESDRIFVQSEVNVSELNNFAKIARKAINRRLDQIMIDALDGSTTSNTIAAGGTNMTLAKLNEANYFANENNWDEDGRHIAIGAKQLQSLLLEEKLTSADYSTIKNLQNGSINSFMGFTFHVFGSLSTGGLPLAGSIRTCFAWQEDCMGRVDSVPPAVRIFPLDSDLNVPTTAFMKSQDDVLLDEGVIKISCDES